MNFDVPRVPPEAKAIHLEEILEENRNAQYSLAVFRRMEKRIHKKINQADEWLSVLKKHQQLKQKQWICFKQDLDQLSVTLSSLTRELIRYRKKRSEI